MTCIVGVKIPGPKGDRVLLAADSCVSRGSWRQTIGGSKLVVAGPLRIGVAGFPVHLQALRYSLALPAAPPLLCREDIERYLYLTAMPAIRACITIASPLEDEETGDEAVDAVVEALTDSLVGVETRSCGSNLLIGIGGLLFEMESNFQLTEIGEPFTAVGSGCEVSTGAMLTAMNLGASPAAVAKAGLDAASRFMTNVSPPYTFVNSDMSAPMPFEG